MRWVALVALMGMLLSGCAGSQPAAAQADGLVGFYAQYTTMQQTQEGPVRGTLTLDFSGPVRAADRDMAVRDAYRLDVIWDRQLQAGVNWTTYEPWAVDYLLDGAFRVVRHMEPEVEGGHGALRHVSWDLQGAPAPFGLGWQQAHAQGAEVLVQGRPQPSPFASDDGWWSYDAAELPSSQFYSFRQLYHYASGGDLLPDLFALEDEEGTVHGELTWYVPGVALPVLPAWELARMAPPEDGAAWQVFPGEDIDHVGIGVSPKAMLAELVRQRPEVEGLLATGCLDVAVSYVGGGSSGPTVPVVGLDPFGSWSMALQVVFIMDGRRHEYEVRYHASTGEGEWEVSDEPANAGSPRPCVQRGFAAPRTLLETMQEGWRLPLLESGVPCSAMQRRQAVLGRDGEVPWGARLWVHLVFPERENDPFGAARSMASLTWDEAAGAWDEMTLHYRDLERLDAGGWEERPLPREPSIALSPQPHCIRPEPMEFP